MVGIENDVLINWIIKKKSVKAQTNLSKGFSGITCTKINKFMQV